MCASDKRGVGEKCMRNSKLDALLWEQMPFDNLIIQGNSVITQENLDYIPFEDIDELCLSRDDDYNPVFDSSTTINNAESLESSGFRRYLCAS